MISKEDCSVDTVVPLSSGMQTELIDVTEEKAGRDADLLGRPDRTRADRDTVLLTVFAQQSSAALAYHSIVININVMFLSVNTFLIGYLIGPSTAVLAISKHLLAAIPAVLAGCGIIATAVIRSHYRVIAAVIRRVDGYFGSFDVDYFFPGDPLYPNAWRKYGTQAWHDIIFDMFIPMEILMGCIGVALVSLR